MKCLLPLLLFIALATIATAQEKEYDEDMGLPHRPYKSYKEYIPVLIARLADSSIKKRNCGPALNKEHAGHDVFSLCMTASDYHLPYLTQSKETGQYAVFVENHTIHESEDDAAEIAEWFLKKKAGMPVSYATYRLVSEDKIQYFVYPLALKNARNTAAEGSLNYAIRIDYEFYKGKKSGIISYLVYPLHRPRDLEGSKEVQGFPDYISLLQYIVALRGAGNYASIKSNYEPDGDYHLSLHSPDIGASWVQFNGARALVVLSFMEQGGKTAERFETVAAALKSAKWPAPFTTTVTDDDAERRCQFSAAGYPVAFSLVYRKRKNLMYLRVHPPGSGTGG